MEFLVSLVMSNLNLVTLVKLVIPLRHVHIIYRNALLGEQFLSLRAADSVHRLHDKSHQFARLFHHIFVYCISFVYKLFSWLWHNYFFSSKTTFSTC